MIDIMRSKSLDRLKGHPLFMSAHLRSGVVSHTEVASGAAGGCPQSVESTVLRAFENVFDVAGDVLRAFEDASRTSVSLKILYLCRSVRGLLPAYGLQSTPDSDKARMVNPS